MMMKPLYNILLLTILNSILLSKADVLTISEHPLVTLNIEYKDEETFKIKVQGALGYWVGLGFGDEMKNSDMHLISFVDENQYVLKDTYSLGRRTPTEDTELGGTSDLTNVQYGRENGQITISYERLLNTGDKYDKQLKTNQGYRIMTSVSRLPVSYHGGGNYEYFDIKLTSKVKEGF